MAGNETTTTNDRKKSSLATVEEGENLLVKSSHPHHVHHERQRKKSVIDKLLYTDNSEVEATDNDAELINLEPSIASSAPKEEKREQWNSFMEYFLSIIGFVIDLGNVWRFPTVCYQNGGGAFLIPFLICLFIIGMPCMYLELAAGQYFRCGNITIWSKMSPFMKGIGYSCVIINVLMLSYYNTLQSYALYYLFYSFESPVPWSVCDREWNTPLCTQHHHVVASSSSSDANQSSILQNSTSVNSSSLNATYAPPVHIFLPATEFFTRKLLGAHQSTGFTDLAGMKFDMLLCVFVIFVMTTGCLVGGIRTSGKAVYVTALLPYICLAVLIGQSLFLEGSWMGLKYYLTPNFDKIFELRVWLAAAVQTFFSLGPGFGVLITYASYTKKNTNIKTLTILCSIVNCMTSLLYGVVVFAGLGYMANRLQVEINFFLRDGIGLVYVVYPEIIATFRGAYIFAVIFFIMLITLGMDSAFGGMEGLYTAIVDEYPWLKRHSLLARIVISSVPFITCLPTVTFAGIYVVQWLDTFAISPSVLLIVCIEVLTVAWIYGLDKFCSNVHEMNGTWPFLSWRLSWKYICPLALLVIVILDITFFEGLNYGDYCFPVWSSVLGYAINFGALMPIPCYAAYYYFFVFKPKQQQQTANITPTLTD